MSSPDSDTGVRQRKKHTKAFTGCLGCKRRRMKCDEEAPSCRRCQKNGARCEYKPLFAKVFEPTTAISCPSTASTAWQIRIVDTSVKPSEQRAAAYYLDRAAPIFSAYFGHEFYCTLVPQMLLHDVGTRKVVQSVSAFFEAVEFPEQRSMVNFFAKYNLAIQSIATSNAAPTIETLITACVLFTCLELNLGEVPNAVKHILAGLQIVRDRCKALSQRDRSANLEVRLLTQKFEPMLGALAIHIFLYGTNIVPLEQMIETVIYKYELPHVPARFSNLLQAHHCLSGIIHDIALGSSAIAQTWFQRRISLFRSLLDRWQTALDKLVMELSTSYASTAKAAFSILYSNHQLARIIMHILDLKHRGMVYSAQESLVEFCQIIAQYEAAGLDKRDHTLMQRGKTSHLNTDNTLEMLPSLFFMAIICQVPRVRARALEILGGINRHEAGWSSSDAHKAALLIISRQKAQLISNSVNMTTRLMEGGKMMKNESSSHDYDTAGQTLPCLHVASIQWPLSHIMLVVDPNQAAESFLDNCSCKFRPA